MAGPDRIHPMRGERRYRRRRTLSLLLGLVMIASLAIPVGVASAGIGASGTGAPLSTAGPDLRTATIQGLVADETVRFCFDQTVANFSGDQTMFHLTGYNDTLLSTGTDIEGTGNPACLDVEFANSQSDISNYTVGTVDAPTGPFFTDSSGNNNNTMGSAALSGFTQGPSPIAGRTTGPDLTGATRSLNTVTYSYDEKLDSTYACQLLKFGFWDNTGTENAAPALSCVYPLADPFSVQVTFGPGTADNAVRYFSLATAVRDRGDDAGDNDLSPLGSTTQDISCAGPVDCTADLTAVSRLSDELVRFTFDQGAPGTTCTAGNFEVYEEDGSQYLGNTCVVESSAAGSTIVTVDFDGGTPTTNFSPFETPTAGANENALTGVTNTHGALALAPGSQESSGFTDAPDLEAATFGSFSRVTFDFDENVNTVNPGALCVVDVNGVTDCTNPGVTTTNGDKVTKDFTPATFNTAVGAMTLDGAVSDFASNTSTQAAVGRGPAANAGTIQFSASTYTVNEGSTATITVTRTGGSSGAASVQYSTSNGTATGADYTGTSGTLNWADGDASSRSFNVSTADDFLGEGTETVNLSLFGATGAALGTPSAATLSIIDNDAAGSLAFSSSTYSVSESAGAATITVTRSGGSSGSVSVNYSTSNGTATAGSDYTSTAGTLFFGNGVTSQSFNVPITNDTAVEGNETVNLSLSGPSGATLGFPTTAVLTITDDDVVGAGQLALGSATNTVDEDAGSLTLTVNRTGGTTGVVSVNYSTTPGSAAAGSDYQAVSGTVTFLAGETTKTFLVPILNDATHESTESFTVSLSNPNGGATIGTPGSTTVSITDDDPAAPGDVTSAISIRYRNRTNRFKGRVTVPFAGTAEISAVCREDREVILRKTNGRRRGSTFTGPDGRWRIFKNNPNGGWYAVAKATAPRTLSDGSQVICTRAESRVIFP